MPSPAATVTPDALRRRLDAVGQGHVLRFWDRLTPGQRDALVAQVQQVDWDSLPRLVETYVRHKPVATLPEVIEPAPYFAAGGTGAHGSGRPWDRRAARAAGDALVRAGKVACFTVGGRIFFAHSAFASGEAHENGDSFGDALAFR